MIENTSKAIVPIVGPYITLIALAFVFVALRVTVKIKKVRSLGPEDYACIFALACAITSTYFMCAEAFLSKDSHDLTLFDLDRLSDRLKVTYACIITYNLAVVVVKFSFLLQYLRIFRQQKDMRIVIWTVFGIVTIYGLWSFFSTIFTCWPIETFWMLVYGASYKKCMSPSKFYVAHAGMGLATDVLILLLPLPGLRRLMLPRAQKFGLILVYLLGGFTCIASGLRLAAFVKAFDGTLKVEWGGVFLGVWTSIEMNIAIVCCCLPSLRPAVTRIWSKMKGDVWVSHTQSFFSALFGTRLSGWKSRSRSSSEKPSSSSSSSSKLPFFHKKKFSRGRGIKEGGAAGAGDGSGSSNKSPDMAETPLHESSRGSSQDHKARPSELSSQFTASGKMTPAGSTYANNNNSNVTFAATTKPVHKGDTSWLTMTQTVYDDDNDLLDEFAGRYGVAGPRGPDSMV